MLSEAKMRVSTDKTDNVHSNNVAARRRQRHVIGENKYLVAPLLDVTGSLPSRENTAAAAAGAEALGSNLLDEEGLLLLPLQLVLLLLLLLMW